ncbi:MAG: sigma-54-dependent transcriptional regulator [Thermodesulfobacteriota bacterium]
MHNTRILLAEDDEIMRITLSDRLRKHGWQVDEACDGREALALLKKNAYHLLISDIRMPHAGGEALLAEVLHHSPATDVIFMTAYGSVEDAVQCLKKGAADYLLKPFDMDDLVIRVKRLLENQEIKLRCASLEQCCQQARKPIIGNSPAMRALLHLIAQVAPSDATVLITGESGTGKELVASAIHYSSPRAQGPFVRVNCAAIPEGLMESELFGHEKGAFTGADVRKIGRFEMANNGTILLDEIGELPLHLQAKLLRVLQEREIERVGGGVPIRIDVRVLCATARKLLTEVREGRFREDLYYRLQVIPVAVPSLRERKEDIPELCAYFFKEFSRSPQTSQTLSPAALEILMAYDYPGNVRELRNIIERVTVLNPSSVVEPWLLPGDMARSGAVEAVAPAAPLKLADAIAAAERSCIQRALRQAGGKKGDAALLLGISRKNLWEKMKAHQLEE